MDTSDLALRAQQLPDEEKEKFYSKLQELNQEVDVNF